MNGPSSAEGNYRLSAAPDKRTSRSLILDEAAGNAGQPVEGGLGPVGTVHPRDVKSRCCVTNHRLTGGSRGHAAPTVA